MIIPIVLTIIMTDGTQIDKQMCSIKECLFEGRMYKKSKEIANVICFKNVPKRNLPFLIPNTSCK